MPKRLIALGALSLCLSLPAVWAQAPSTIGYQGVLTDNSGVAVANGSYSLSFSLYTAASGGSALWTETQSVSTTSGVFNVVLGSVTPLNIAFNQPLYLGISVGGTELSPRIALNAAPYSLMAKGVEDGAVTSAKIADGTVATADLANSAVTTTQIADGTVTAGDINSGQVVKSVNALTDAVTLAAGSNVTITPSGNTLTIAAAGANLADGAVTTAKLADNAVTGTKITDGTIATADLADNAVTSAKVVDGTVATADLADNAVTTAKLADGTVTAGDINSGQVVKSVNALTDAVTLAAGSNVTITPSGNTLTIAATGGSGSTLDQAYDQGGAGAGRTITADAGAVDIAGSGGLTVNGNVGIGTTSPAATLHVNSGSSTLNTVFDGTGLGPYLRFRNGGSPKWDIGHDGGAGAGKFFIYDASNSQWRMLIDASGNVGIGTTSPGAKLHIVGNTALTLEETGATTRTLAFVPPQLSAAGSILGNSANGLNLGVSAAGDLNFLTNNTTRATIQSGGNLGIGTTSPNSKLDVNGLILVSGASSPTSGSGLNLYRTGDGTAGVIDSYNWGTSTRLRTEINGNPLALNATGGGNVGIGTTSPGTKLHILGGGWRTEVTSGSLGSEMKTGETASHYNFLAFRTGVYNATSGYTRSNAPWEIGVQQDGNGSSAATDRIYLGRSGVSSSDLVVSRDGNVGIGTTSPTFKLDVAGTGRFTGGQVNITGSGGNAELTLFPEAGTPDGTISTERTGGALRFRTRNSGGAVDERMRISSEGNVGIGTTSPANLLTIQQTSATDPIADAWTTYSSRRWKEHIRTLSGSLDQVQRLRGVSYQWKANSQRDIGLIAEEVGQVIPEVVAYEENGKDAKSVDYARLVAVLIEAVKEQQKEIEAQRVRIEALERAAVSGRFSAKAGE